MSNAVELPSPQLLDQGDPADDARAFRRALGQFATGITIVATNSGDRMVGMAANSFSAVSLDPPLVLWSIRKESKSAPSFIDNGHFSVNVLSEDQMAVSALFGRPAPDQFEQLDWTAGQRGDPLLAGSIAQFECVNEAVLDGGDHHILVGRVERFATFAGAPLLFTQGQYAVAHNHPALTPDPRSRSEDDDRSEESLFMSLLQAADLHMSTLFEEHRRQVGLTVATARILNRLSRGACDPVTLERETFLGDNTVEDALSELRIRNQVTDDEDGIWALTDEGRRVRTALRRGAEQFTEQQLRGIPSEDLAAAERVLTTLLSRSSETR